ncbi:MAG TPA: argininosuccinate synthase [Deltaproteobacteria bacterium]|nr:argininosuccinate synthase [Deltaproteobacteria bacterium]HPJ94205.1 argininosuccinate synthase [Deltaproteobacteria bacterium]HPR51428.1 argininosuccinate synthase [Deltaproteobacteria bacterium]
MSAKKVVLAYSGGLDTSVILKWLQDEFGYEVICYAADVGQAEELNGLEAKAKKTGASKIYIDDVREEFVRDYVFPAYRADVAYEGTYLLGTSLARPLIAQKIIEIARKEGAEAVAHGATGKGNDQVRFELTFWALNPSIKVIAPWKMDEWKLTSRDKMIDYAAEHGIDVPVSKAKPYSMDRNLLHISFEGGILEDLWNEPREDMFVLSCSPEEAPDEATSVVISFKDGDPVAIDSQEMSPAELLATLNQLGGKNGIGRVDIVENRYVGMKSRGVYETPGGTILKVAHRGIEQITMDKELMHLRDELMPRYATLIYNGYWFAPERYALQKLIDESQKGVTGDVRVKLYKGNCIITGRRAEASLYNPEVATFDEDEVYDQKDAAGFIRLNALRLKMRKQMEP